MWAGTTTMEGASKANNFTTPVPAVKAGVVDTLSGNGPLTVSATTNKAFENLPARMVHKLMEPDVKGAP
ncbi:fasciclin domain-containing protein [Methylobacterium oryzae]|uniref:FAS1 domain-containing protein n=1 Tax=Methylobacterium oryzae TaxID=334852 RepID=A0ABU7TZ07_9HYPH